MAPAAGPEGHGPQPIDDFRPVAVLPGRPGGRLLLLGDHASRGIPPEYRSLGLPEAELGRHIAYDIGVEPLARALAERLGAPAVLAGFSRLLIDPNRGEDDPTLLMRLSDGAVIPGNARADERERERRLARFYRPYHAAIDAELAAIAATGQVPLILSLHSFTPVWRGSMRPWHAALLSDVDRRFGDVLIRALGREPGMIVGDNEPYSGGMKGDTMYRHASRFGIPHALIEVRQDLIGDAAGVREWTDRLAPLAEAALAVPELGCVRHFGSRSGPLAPEIFAPGLPACGPERS